MQIVSIISLGVSLDSVSPAVVIDLGSAMGYESGYGASYTSEVRYNFCSKTRGMNQSVKRV